jgi:hypothetical protein
MKGAASEGMSPLLLVRPAGTARAAAAHEMGFSLIRFFK